MEVDEIGDGPVVPASDDPIRIGLLTRAGLEVKATSHLAIRVEGSALSVRNPFDGENAFRVEQDRTVLDEPEAAPLIRFNLGLAYSL